MFTGAGRKRAIDKFCAAAKEANALQARPFNAGCAFHTELMQPAQDDLNEAIDRMIDRMEPPHDDVYFNVAGRKVKAGSAPETFVDHLKRQLTSEVLWERSVQAMILDGANVFIELGPLKQLKGYNKKIDADAYKRTANISV